MKKLLYLLTACALMLSLAACGSKADEDKQPDEDPVQEETPIDDKQETPETDDASKDEPSDDSVKTEPDANKDEKPGEAGFTVGQLSQRQLEERLPALRALGVELENRITIADF